MVEIANLYFFDIIVSLHYIIVLMYYGIAIKNEKFPC